MLQRLAGVRRQARRYFGTVAWLFGLVLRRYRARTVIVFGASTAGVALVAAGMAAVFAIVSVLETGGAISLAGVEVTGDVSGSLLGVTILAAFTIIVGAGFVYLARQTAIAIATDLMNHLGAAVLAAAGPSLPHPLDFRSDRHVRRAMARLRGAYVNKCFMVVRRAFELPMHVLVFTVGIAALFWLQHIAASALAAAIMIAVPVFYLVNRSAVAQTKRFEELTEAAMRHTRGLASTFARRPHDAHATVHAAYERSEPIRQRTTSFARRFLVTARSDLTSQLTGAIALFVLVTFFGRQVMAGTLSITAILAFMVVARFVLVAMRGMFNAFATVSRHYPSLHRLNQVFDSQSCADVRRTIRLEPDTLTLRLRRDGLRDEHAPRSRLPLARGQVVTVSAPVTPTRYSAWYYATLLTASDDPAVIRAARDAIRIAAVPPEPETPTTPRRHYVLPDDITVRDIERRAGADVVAALLDAGMSDLDTEATPEAFSRLPATAQRQLALMAAVESARDAGSIAVVAPFAMAPDAVHEVAPDMVLVLRVAGAPSRPVADVHVVAASDASVVAWGSPSWVQSNWRTVAERLATVEAALLRIHGEDQTEDEDDG